MPANTGSTVRTTSLKLGVLVVAMFVFALWVMPPLYDAFCDLAGINGKTKGRYEAVKAEVDTSRNIQIRFVATNNEAMPWGFSPAEDTVVVHPGEVRVTRFLAHNPTDKIMVAQAVPSMVPHNATDYFLKTECFCFNQQVLGPGESAELGLQFIVDQDVPKAVNAIVLSYTLFDVTKSLPEIVEQKRIEIAKAVLENNNKPANVSGSGLPDTALPQSSLTATTNE